VKFWTRRGAIAWLLWPVGLLFLVAVCVRRLLYILRILKSSHPGIPVIVVGNLTVGGSGKTPLVIWIAEFLKSKGWSPGIVSRGYGAQIAVPRAATVASDAAEVGDEPILLSRRSGCPVWVGADRVRVAALLRAAHEDVNLLILDDGLQHYAMRRDLEIAVVDARGFGNGFPLPAGPLREPQARLRGVDAVVSHESPIKGFAMRLDGVDHAVGRISFRVGSTHTIEHYAGHVGYEVAAAFRGHRLAERSCRLILPLARRHGFDTLWITCNPDNVASRRTCERLGAELVGIVDVPPDNDVFEPGGERKCRYRLAL